ncbi:Cytidylyltransferase family, putative [Entamoeba histolytica]
MKIKQLTTLKIAVVIALSCYTLIYRKQYVMKNYITPLYLLGYGIDLILSIIAHYSIKSKFFQQFKCYNDDTTVIEFHCLLMNVSLSFLTTKSHSAIYIHIICLLLVFLLSISILCNVQFMRFKVPFTYCEFGTHISLLFLLIFVQQPQFFLAPSTIQSFIKNYPSIIIMWIFLLVLMVVIAFIPHQPMYVSVQRKSFHFIAALIYTIGIRSNALFLSVLSNNLVVLFVILDFLRIKLAPTGILSQLFQRYRDSHQDPNLSLGFPAFLLLYVNTLPLLLFRSHFHCAIISSIITVDIGDAFAAIVGSYCGKYFPITRCGNKTLIGTLSFIITSIFFGMIINTYIPLYLSFNQLVLISITSGLMELTCENDNLILPLFSLLFI